MSSIETPAEREAQELLTRLHGAGIWLQFEGDQVKWTTHTEHGLTIADVRAIKRLTPELKLMLASIEAVDAAVENRDRERSA